ncbi:MAG: hypothetical protein A2096_07740 [Spirochaetes bacterium GWF1_41_5]|nr:MAG: hypothetical protein A2096_07740 [Spirochaetes bacterium GWF1_41_5]HBE02994.1 chemotaxis protein CheW [Spirochaetia bacterium]
MSTDAENQYVAFKLGNEEYGVKILSVQEIYSLPVLTRIPNTPPFIKGVINLRGDVIPIIDLRTKFNMEHQETGKNSVIIVAKTGAEEKNLKTIGMVVDTVSDVLTFSRDNIQDMPEFSSGINTRYIEKMGKIGDRLVILLNLEKLLSLEELTQIDSISRK